jgi:DNA-dependent RNA polymerase auxiliary subunit epsilon
VMTCLNTFHLEFIRLVSDDMFKYIPFRIYQVSK